jgi:methionine biosynthesis protein MetW
LKPADYYEHDRPEILEAIPRNASRVLDVGCGSGGLGQHLKQRQGARVWGIEVMPEAAKRAAQRLDKVWNAQVEQVLLEIPDDEAFDCIVTADVLEHLVDPWTVLGALGRRLTRGGTLVASIPNVGHWEVVRDLLEGSWRYTAEGLLDRTHLRFFTRRSIRELFWTAGLTIREITAKAQGQGVPPALFTALRGAGLRVSGLLEEGEVFQYRVVAERKENPQTWPRVGIAVLSGHHTEDTLRCVESIQRLAYTPLDTVVIDAGSSEDTADAIRARFPEVTLLEAGGNLGDAAGKNVGIRHALDRGAEYVLVLDRGQTFDPMFLSRLMDLAVLCPEAGIWGPRLRHDLDPDTVWATSFKWDAEQRNFTFDRHAEAPTAADTVHIVEALAGSVMLVHRDVFDRLGMLASAYRHCWVGIDFCTRAIEHGFTCVIVPGAQLWSKPETSMGEKRSAVREYFDARDRLLWASRHLPSRQFNGVRRQILREVWRMLPDRPGRRAGARKLYWWVVATAQVYRNPFVRARLRAVLDHWRGRLGDCPESVGRSDTAVQKTGASSDIG